MPDRQGNGLAMRLGLFLDAFRGLARVDLVVLPVAGSAIRSALVEDLDITPRIIPVAGRIDTQFRLLSQIADRRRRLDAFQAFGRPSLCAALTGPLMGDLRKRVSGTNYDLIHISRLYLAPLRALWPGLPDRRFSIDLDEDDVAARRSLARLHRRRGHDFAAEWEAIEARRYEAIQQEALASFGLSTIASSVDRGRIRERRPGGMIRVVQNAAPIPNRVSPLASARPLVTFVGSLSHAPNLDAALWLCRTIWPRLRRSGCERAELRIVGRNPPAQLVEQARIPGVRLEARLDNLADLYRRSTIVVAPIRAGGGTRIKLIEAAAHHVPVVSTRFGAEGLGLRHGQHLWLADGAADFVQTCSAALGDAAARAVRADAAYREVRRQHAWEIVRARLRGILAPLLT